MASSDLKAVMKFFVDRDVVRRRIERKKLRVLTILGAYTRGTIRRKIRPQKKSTKASRIAGRDGRLLSVGSLQVFVPHRGKVLDAKTFQPVSKQIADQARRQLISVRTKEGAGKPPRRGPTDNLREFTYFSIDIPAESVVIGPEPFIHQPRLVGRVSVPELLERGGGEYIGRQLVQYDPHPYLEPSQQAAEKRFRELIERVQL